MSEIHVFFKKVNMREEVYDLLKTSFLKLFGEEAPNVFKDKNGKPYFDGKPDIHFSISHSGDYAMCAISGDPIGADIQKTQEISQKMLKRVFTENELENADPISLWCLKESFVKFKGKLDREYRNIEFLKADDVFFGPDDTKGILINEMSGYMAAVCMEKLGNINVLML